MINGIQNNINFTAKMDVSKINENKKRWENIAKLYEQETQNYPNDTFTLKEYTEDDNSHSIHASGIKSDKDNYVELEYDLSFSENLLNKLYKLTDKQIVQKFKTVMSLAHKQEQIFEKTQNFLNDIGIEQGDEYETPIWESVCAKTDNITQERIQKDDILKDAHVTI